MEEVRQLLAVAFVFVLLGLAVWVLRGKGGVLAAVLKLGFRRGPGKQGSGRLLHSVERLVLTPQHSLHVVRFSDRELLVAVHPQGCSVLSTADGVQGIGRGAGA